MCSQDTEACGGPKCTCDNFYTALPPPSGPPPGPAIPPQPAAPPAYPPAMCDSDAMGALKMKLKSMIKAQQDKNIALQTQVYDTQQWPHMPPKPPSPPPPSPYGEICVNVWGQCGGKNYGGSNFCCKGTCQYQNPFYSQCRKEEDSA